MSKIAEQIQKLEEEKKRLARETRKVEFFNHILESARGYEHEDFRDVRNDVVNKLDQFIKKMIEAIEVGSEITITVGPATQAPTTNVAPTEPAVPAQPNLQQSSQLKPQRESEPSPNDKLAFALDNRHLGGKKVSVLNDKNIEIKGQVVGLDAPFVIVKTDTGPTIKVPLPNVVLQ